MLHVAPQNLVEFRNAALGPRCEWLGLPATEVEAKTSDFEVAFPLLAETPDIYPAWKALVGTWVLSASSIRRRLVVVCHLNGVSHLLTFNTANFTRLAAQAPGIVVVDPVTV